MIARRLLAPLLLAALCGAVGIRGPGAHRWPRRACRQFPPAPGRPVAPIVSPTWGDSRQRDAAHEIDQIVARLKLKPGQTVGDLGAGRGYDTLRLAHVLGPSGRVIAEDVDPDALEMLGAEAQRRRLSNVVIALGEPQDPRLPPRSLDAAILVHMYHEIAHPYAFLYNLIAALKPGARVGVEELDRPTPSHGTPTGLVALRIPGGGLPAGEHGPSAGRSRLLRGVRRADDAATAATYPRLPRLGSSQRRRHYGIRP